MGRGNVAKRCLHVFVLGHTEATFSLSSRDEFAPSQRVLRIAEALGPMHPSSSTGNSNLDQERQRFQQQIADLDITQDDDPLDIYYQYVQWLDHNYSPEHAVDSGLVDLLEEATKAFLKDNHYKSDLRYLKLWVLYAKHIEDPGSVYSHLLSKSIGTSYALLYE
jgi:checkpoint serine/threonine-protein kinase